MTEIQVQVLWKHGLHARPASRLAAYVREMNSKVTLSNHRRMVSATRIIDLIELGVQEGESVRLIIEGGDELENGEKLKAFFAQGEAHDFHRGV